ncbi:beta-1,3-galactosyltransferase 2 isoform X1 [Esox lucius]|uniref:beta-1,3-galactosyltransferase 2 isoform X1 n=1 Tax=Esox lucius TaxID=8010 RepID=UPI001476B22B|nr:beta-1,3-galactosyltransferase 2 isoform X1 [Esox lucius]
MNSNFLLALGQGVATANNKDMLPARRRVLTLFVNILLKKKAPRKTTPSPLSQELYKVISPESYKYVFNQASACKDRTPFLVLMVPVAPSDGLSRAAIRKTWGAPGLMPNVDILTLFYVGLPEEGHHSHIQQDLERESREHGDIIQMDFQDHYQNLTIKTMMIMNWLATHCQEASYAMKVDTDIFVNVFYLVNRLLVGGGSVRHEYITGSVISDGRPRRDSNSKWRLSKDVYPEDTFPPYVSGAGYVFSIDLAHRISLASRFVRPIPLEDVFVGMCLKELGIRPVYAQTFLPPRNLFEIRRLDYKRCTYATRVIVTGFKPQELVEIWGDFQKGHLAC